jgi:fatty acid desaturase
MNREKVFARWLFPVLTEWGVIVLLFAAGYWINSLWGWLPIVVLLGSRQHAFAILGHDGAHHLAARNKRLNDLATQVLCFWPIGAGLRAYRRFHFRHHRHVGTELDPELIHKNDWSKEQWSIPKTRLQILTYFLGDLVGLGIPEVFKAIRLVGKAGFWDWVGPFLWWATVGTALYLSGYWLAAVVWFAAMYSSFWGFFRLRIWTEHVGTAYVHRVRANWWQRLFIAPYNTWYHYEHHEHPSVPFWKLPELRGKEDQAVSIDELYKSFGVALGSNV